MYLNAYVYVYTCIFVYMWIYSLILVPLQIFTHKFYESFKHPPIRNVKNTFPAILPSGKKKFQIITTL